MPPTTPPIDRRSPEALLLLVQQVHDNQLVLEKKVADVPSEMAKALANLMADAFPEGDPDGHRKHHEAVIKAAEEKAEFWKKMRLAISQWGLIGFLGWAAYALWSAFLQGPHK